MEKHKTKWLKQTKIKMNENIFYKYKDIFQYITSGISNNWTFEMLPWQLTQIN